MNELARAIVLICRLLERTGAATKDDPESEELAALYVTLLRRSESAADYHNRARGQDNLRALVEGKESGAVPDDLMFPELEPPPIPQKRPT